MHGQAGWSRLAIDTASPMWSPWPWVTSRTSHRSTWSAGFGLSGFPNHGSMRIVLPPGDASSTQAWPYQVMVVSRPSVIDHLRAGGQLRDPDGSPSAATAGTHGYTRIVAAQRIAENLAFINWTVLAALGLGAFAAVVLARSRTDATRGYLAFTSACAAVFGLLAYLSDGALPTGVGGTAAVHIDPAFDGARQACLLAFTAIATIYTVVLARGGRAIWLGSLGVAAGVGAFAFGAAGWGGGFPSLLPLLGQSLLLAAATGGVFAAMILGHWYLVTPKLPEAPLVLFARLLMAIVGAPARVLRRVGRGSGPAPAAGRSPR